LPGPDKARLARLLPFGIGGLDPIKRAKGWASRG
jgi:hypothetical protein